MRRLSSDPPDAPEVLERWATAFGHGPPWGQHHASAPAHTCQPRGKQLDTKTCVNTLDILKFKLKFKDC